jgi:hypothetical protein
MFLGKPTDRIEMRYGSVAFWLFNSMNRVAYRSGFREESAFSVYFLPEVRPTVDVHVLFLAAVKPGISYSFIHNAINLISRSAGHFRRVDVVFDSSGPRPPEGRSHPYRQEAFAAIRQQMVDKYLAAHDFCIVFDVDIVDLSEDVILKLVTRCAGGIVAPLVFKRGPNTSANVASWPAGDFYDVAGFVENGRWARHHSPWFRQRGPVYDLDSVGALYCVDSHIFKRGARYVPDAGATQLVNINYSGTTRDLIEANMNTPANCFTEHYSICQWALRNGYFVRAYEDCLALHS